MARTNSNQPEIEITDPVEAVRQKYDNILTLVIIVMGVGFVTLLVTVLGLVIDAWNTKAMYDQNSQNQELMLETLYQMATSTKH